MAAFICRFCGISLDISDSSVCECKGCGRLQSVPLIDRTEKAELFARAEKLRSEQKFDKAMRLFEKMISLTPKDADLYWALSLCKYGVLFFADGGIALARTQAQSFLTDSDYLRAVEFADNKQRGFFEQFALIIDKKRREIAEIATGTEYDVLICCPENEKAAEYAAKLQKALVSEKVNAFFAEETLKGKPKSEWEPFVFAAVNSAKALIITVNSAECFDDISVMNICGRFLSGDLRGKAVIPVLYDVSASVLPREIARFQAVNAHNLGFERDIAASVKALISGRTTAENTEEKSPLVRRAYIMLSDNEFSEAEALCAKIEPFEPAEAALIRLLCEYRLSGESALGELYADFTTSENYRTAMRLGSESMRLRLKKYALSAQDNLNAAMLAAKPQKAELPVFDGTDEVYSVKINPLKKRRVSPLAISLISAGVVAAAIVTGTAITKNAEKRAEITSQTSAYSKKKESFERAETLLDEGKYTEAESIFVSLGNYGKSAERVKKCRYKQAEQLLSQGEIESARGVFEQLGEYGNSAEKVLECDYILAEQTEKRGELQEAAAAFEALGYYSDANERRKSCLYRLAVEYTENGDYKSAVALFMKIEKYSDCAEQLKKAKYALADQQYSLENYSDAYDIFKSLGGWSDSAERAKNSQYQHAKRLYDEGKFSEAVSPLENLGDYLDSRAMRNAAWLKLAVEYIENGDNSKAYDILTYRIDEGYQPAQYYINLLRNKSLSSGSSTFYMGKYYNVKSLSAVNWRVVRVEGNKALVVSESALDYLPFDEYGRSSWANSTIRSWLNGEFYNTAFSSAEKSLIISTNNSGVSDKIFLLSYDDASKGAAHLLNPRRDFCSFYTQNKIPAGVDVHCWGIDGILTRKSTATGYERLSASPAEPNLVFPAMWVIMS